MEVAAIILRRETGELFVHQRASDRRMFPDLYGLGAGGKVNKGETPAEAAKRELTEETGIVADPIPLFSFDFSSELASYRMHIFEVITDQEVVIDAREWQSGSWMNTDGVDALDEWQKLCPDTSIFYKRYRDEYYSTENACVNQ